MLTDLICYDLKVAALIAVFYLFHMLLLARETTHTLNRVSLLMGLVLSAVLPLCVITLHRTVFIDSSLQSEMDAGATNYISPLPVVDALERGIDWTLPLAVILLTGSLVCLLRFVGGYRTLRRIICSGERHVLPSGTSVSVVDAPLAPFSWMHTIVMSREDWLSDPTLILAHEEAHVRHRHSYDVLVVEALTALQWFNPVVWFLRQELRTVHEYEADASVLSSGFDENRYIHLLMQKATGIQACALANGIHMFKTKKRIIMMLKQKSNRTACLKSLYVVPIVFVSLAMTAKTVVDYETTSTEEDAAIRVFNENTNGRGESYQIRHQPGVRFFRNGVEEQIPEGRSIALEVSKTEVKINGESVGNNSLPNLSSQAIREIHLDEISPEHFVADLVTTEPLKYSAKMNGAEFVAYVQERKAAGMDNKELTQTMLNEGGSISRAHMLHKEAVYGSKKKYLFMVDGKEVTSDEFSRMEPESFKSVAVMDVSAASKIYGEKGQRGATVVQTKQQDDDKIFDICEQLPQFPGGEAKLFQFLSRNLKYPKKALEKGVQGRVLVRFVVEKDGSLSNAEVLDPPPAGQIRPIEIVAQMTEKERQDAEAHNACVKVLRDEAIRVVKSMPKWNPGRQRGEVVRCRFSIPVSYRLN